MYISYLYVQTVTRQCFCFPNSQWGATAHDIIAMNKNTLENISNNFPKWLHASLYVFVYIQANYNKSHVVLNILS